MIDSLNGEVLDKGQDHIVLDCGGVGYYVSVPASTLAALEKGVKHRLHVHYSVSVDVRSGSSDHRLFGFAQRDERQLFRRLIDVQGVSATIGMSILCGLSAPDVHTAILTGNVDAFKQVKGIGPKLAQRIVTDLQSKLANVPMPSGKTSQGEGNTLRTEALSALISLGLDRMKAERALQAVLQEQKGEKATVEELIKLTLKNL